MVNRLEMRVFPLISEKLPHVQTVNGPWDGNQMAFSFKPVPVVLIAKKTSEYSAYTVHRKNDNTYTSKDSRTLYMFYLLSQLKKLKFCLSFQLHIASSLRFRCIFDYFLVGG